MSSKTHKLDFFYDCLSPFSYFAHLVLSRYAAVWPVELHYRPFLLGGVMASSKNTPPMMRPSARAKARWQAQDLQRNTTYFGAHDYLGMPSNFFGPDGPADKRGLARDFRVMRLLTAISMCYPTALPTASDLLFRAIHANPSTRDEHGNVVLDEQLFAGICAKAGVPVPDIPKLLEELASPETKQALKAAVVEAVKRGSFGSPTIIITPLGQTAGPREQVYFGSDRFEQMAVCNGWAWSGPCQGRLESKL